MVSWDRQHQRHFLDKGSSPSAYVRVYQGNSLCLGRVRDTRSLGGPSASGKWVGSVLRTSRPHRSKIGGKKGQSRAHRHELRRVFPFLFHFFPHRVDRSYKTRQLFRERHLDMNT